MSFTYFYLEHPIHAPPIKGDPFKPELPDSVGCKLKVKQGVVYVYKDQEHLDKEEPLDWPYLDVQSFLADQNVMYCLIMDGPL